jgi:hypothetical protein
MMLRAPNRLAGAVAALVIAAGAALLGGCATDQLPPGMSAYELELGLGLDGVHRAAIVPRTDK